MNQIYWDVSQISMLTDNLGASTHSHAILFSAGEYTGYSGREKKT